MTIGWERDSYTVGEADGQLQVYVRFTGILDATLPQAKIIVEKGTATRGQGMQINNVDIGLLVVMNEQARDIN